MSDGKATNKLTTEDEQRRDEARERRRIRRRLVKPDPLSRPYLSAKEFRIPDRVFNLCLALVWTPMAVLMFWECFRAHAVSVIYGSWPAAAAILAIALVCMVLIFCDVASYRPRLFALADRDGSSLVDEFVEISGEIRVVVQEFKETPPESWVQVPGRQEQMLSAIAQYVGVGNLRARVAFRILHRLAAMLAALGLVAYALSGLTHGSVIHGAPAKAGLAEHLYFVVSQAVTIGFGDLYPNHNPWGYGLMALSVLTMAAIVYFVLSELVAMHAQFRTDLRTAIERYVVRSLKSEAAAP